MSANPGSLLKTDETVTCVRGYGLSIDDVHEVANGRRRVSLDDEQLEKVRQTHQRVQEWGSEQLPIYGVNTGFGELIPVIVPKRFKSELQHNLIRSHAAGSGPLFPKEVVRAILTVRLNCLMKGYSGISPQVVERLRRFLDLGVHPVIPQQGSLGASGDLAPLSHMALALIGEGQVELDGELRPAAEVLAELELEPLTLGYKEGLALVNGTSAMTGAASLALAKSRRLLKLAIVSSAYLVQCLRASTRPFDDRGHQLKNHRGQITVARAMRRLLEGSRLTRDHGEIMRAIADKTKGRDEVVDTGIYLQNAYSLRCMPQVLGPVLETLDFSRRIVEEELNSCNDNPLIFENAEDTFHGANFHGQYVAMACDYLNVALTEIGVLAERQLNRLIDPHVNGGLPPFLAHPRSGLACGFEGGQYLATSIAAENLDLAAPASIKSIPSNGSNQDVVSMGLTSARRSLQLTVNIETILILLVAACRQAASFVPEDHLSPPIAMLHAELAAVVPRYLDEKPFHEHLEPVRQLLSGTEISSSLDELVDLGDGVSSS